MKAQASRTSPISSSVRSFSSWMVLAHRTFSSASPPTSRSARLSLSWVFWAWSSIRCFSSRASSNCFTSPASFAFSAATWSCTFFSEALLTDSFSCASASFSSLGRISHRMWWYLIMFSAQDASPAAAKDFVLMLSGVKLGSFVMGSAASTQAWGMLSWSKACSPAIHCPTFCIIFLELAQLRSLGIFLGSAVSTITAPATISTSPGGLPMDLSSVRLVLSRESRAARASSTTGLAAARSAAHAAAKASTSSTILFVLASSSAARSLCSPTTSFSFPTNSSNAAVAADFSATTTCSFVSTSFRPATCSEASRILSIPNTSRSVLSTRAVRFTASICLYSAMNSRKDLGVVYTVRRSWARNSTDVSLTISWQ
mmetsp:Transcript_120631/g.210025  ORF Transcript_120631/g.210025 Transcript_120631/m.210025 type:complete len:371 (+) Transcript_120631:2033-3145(+)